MVLDTKLWQQTLRFVAVCKFQLQKYGLLFLSDMLMAKKTLPNYEEKLQGNSKK